MGDIRLYLHSRHQTDYLDNTGSLRDSKRGGQCPFMSEFLRLLSRVAETAVVSFGVTPHRFSHFLNFGYLWRLYKWVNDLSKLDFMSNRAVF